jgi:hypothetical protein
VCALINKHGSRLEYVIQKINVQSIFVAPEVFIVTIEACLGDSVSAYKVFNALKPLCFVQAIRTLAHRFRNLPFTKSPILSVAASEHVQ